MFQKELAYVEERRLAIAERRAQASPTHRPLLPTPSSSLASPNATRHPPRFLWSIARRPLGCAQRRSR